MEVKELIKCKEGFEASILEQLKEFSRLYGVQINDIHMRTVDSSTINDGHENTIKIIQEVKLDIRL